MKKLILVILLIFLLSACKAGNIIYNSLYIASIGFEKNEEVYTGYFYLPSSVSVGNLEQTEAEDATIAKVDGSSISEIFNNFETSSYLKMNLKHISSIVFSESIMNDANINDFINYVKNSDYFDYNFYIFVTTDKIEDIYKVKNPNNENVILTILCEPVTNPYTYLSAKPIHFLNFCRDFYNHKVIKIALLEAENIWSENFDSVVSKSVCFYGDNKARCVINDQYNFCFFNDVKKFQYDEKDLSILFTNYKCDISYFDSIKIKIRSNVKFLTQPTSIEKIEEKIKTIILNLINMYEKDIDFLNLECNNAFGKKIELDVRLEEI